MKRILKILLILTGLVLLISSKEKFRSQVLGRTVQYIRDISIDWGVPSGKPIFYVNDFKPGDEETRCVKIMNTSSKVRIVGIQGIKTSLLSFLGTVLEITISQNGNDIYGGSKGTKYLSQFFLDSIFMNSIRLISLNPGENKTVCFKVKFKSSAGNLYQKTKVVFDLRIGYYLTELTGCGGISYCNPCNFSFPKQCFFTR